MSRPLCTLAAVLALGACPAKRPNEPSQVGAGVGAGVGCPSASGVYVASYVRPGEDGKGHTGWVLPLHDAKVATLEGVAEFAPVDAAAATAAGVPAPPQNLWLLLPNMAPCKATIGGYYAAAIDAPTPNVAYGAELTGCPAPPDPSDAVAIALVSDEVPAQCKPHAPRPVAARLGETDKANVWWRPTKETPIPPAFAKVVPEKDCKAPDCEKLWSIASVDVGGKPVAWAGAVNWLAIPPGAKPASQCDWKAETFAGFFVTSADGTPVKVPPVEPDHPLVLTAVLVDAGGARVVLAEGTGEYAAYDLANGEAKLGRHLVWLVDGPEAYGAVDRIGPDCGP
jgi:hypothetical protein